MLARSFGHEVTGFDAPRVSVDEYLLYGVAKALIHPGYDASQPDPQPICGIIGTR